MGFSLKDTTTIAAFALSAATASAQSVYIQLPQQHQAGPNIWQAPPHGYVAPRVLTPVLAPLTAEDKCREMVAFQPPQKIFPRARTSFLQAGNIGCRFQEGPAGLLVAGTYPLRSTSGVKSFVSDIERAEKTEDRLRKQEMKDTNRGHDNYGPRRSHRDEPRFDRTPDFKGQAPADRSTGPGKRDESFDDLRNRKQREHRLTP